MDMTTITQYFVPQIVAFCLCVGYIMKRWLPMDNKWIPTVLFVIGIICGMATYGTNFIIGIICGIATTGMSFDGVVFGAVSGLASVGLNQSFQQALGLNVRPNIEMTDDEVQDFELAEEEDEADEEGEADE